MLAQTLASDPQIHTDGGIVQVKVDHGKDVEFHVGSKVSSVGSFEKGLADLGRQARADQQCACDAAEDVVGTAGAHAFCLCSFRRKQTMACPCIVHTPVLCVWQHCTHTTPLTAHMHTHTHVCVHIFSTSRSTCSWTGTHAYACMHAPPTHASIRTQRRVVDPPTRTPERRGTCAHHPRKCPHPTSAVRSPARAHDPVCAQGKSAVEISAKLSKDVAKIVAESVGVTVSEALKNISNTQVGHRPLLRLKFESRCANSCSHHIIAPLQPMLESDK